MSGLQKRITFTSGVAISVAMVVGSGLFGLPGLAISATNQVTAFLGWVAVILIIPPLIHIFAKLGMRYPDAAGISKYAEVGIGAWSRNGISMIALGGFALGMPVSFLVIGTYIVELLGVPSEFRYLAAAVIVAASTYLNVRGVENLSAVNSLVVVLIIAFIVGMAAIKLPAMTEASRLLAIDIVTTPPDFAGLWVVAAIVFWAFTGWESMSFGLEEFKNPERTIPLVFWSGFVIVAIMYLLFAWLVSAAHYEGISVEGMGGVATLLGDGNMRVVLLSVLVFVLVANGNSWAFSANRLAYAAARQGLLPAALGRLDKRNLPTASLWWCLAYYVAVIFLMWALSLGDDLFFLLTNQFFILLYGVTIIAFLRYDHSIKAVIIALFAFAGWAFLMSGFSWMMVFPALLFAFGTWRHFKAPPVAAEELT